MKRIAYFIILVLGIFTSLTAWGQFYNSVASRGSAPQFVQQKDAYLYHWEALQHLPQEQYYCTNPADSIQVIYDIQPLKHSESPPNWIFYVILGMISTVAFLWVNFYRNIVVLFRSLANMRIERQLQRQEEYSLPLYALIASLLFYSVGGLYLFLVLRHYEVSLFLTGYQLFLGLVLLLFVVYMIRYFVMRFIAIVFPFGPAVEFYRFTISMVNRCLGLTLIPFVFLIAYGSPFLVSIAIYSSLGVVAIFLLVRITRGIAGAIEYIGFYKFYFFLYLCSVEVAPVFIFVKGLSKFV